MYWRQWVRCGILEVSGLNFLSVEHQQSAYTTKIVTCSLDEAWNFAAVTSKLATVHGVYRGHAGNKYIFMTTGEIHLNTESEKQHWVAMTSAASLLFCPPMT
jgi:hypothetical protein